ncbi:MAG TPA: hypothetical protein DCR08_05520, partial [Lactobacillus sp.]|nr:hypothetical protein [Lactobacillus sp.]
LYNFCQFIFTIISDLSWDIGKRIPLQLALKFWTNAGSKQLAICRKLVRSGKIVKNKASSFS